ncbi:SOS response-associated peptidase family protein, partial [Sphingomonas sp. S6]|uniref:SOS response-associated peptidase family protein n=1 Tax=Sphingomonas sp. S6 TaxID=3368600 RepID=UPI00373E4A88
DRHERNNNRRSQHGPVSGGATSSRNEGAQSSRKRGAASSESAPTERGNAYSFLTTEPNFLVSPIHPKAMPVILHDDDYARWLTGPWNELEPLVSPYPAQLMRLE